MVEQLPGRASIRGKSKALPCSPHGRCRAGRAKRKAVRPRSPLKQRGTGDASQAGMSLDNAVGLGLALLLVVYLAYALVKPEKF